MVGGLVGRKAEAFAALLDGPRPSTGATATTDPAMAQLANLAQRLSIVPQPTAAFRTSLRHQLMATANQTAAGSATHAAAGHAAAHTAAHAPLAHSAGSSLGGGLATLGKTAPVWVKVFAGIAAVGVSATGVGIGAHRALPGDLFYGVKKQVEAVQLDLASGSRGKADAEIGFAQARLDELHKLLKRDHVAAGKPVSKATAGHIKGLLENWADETGVATTSLIKQIQALGADKNTAAESAELRAQLSRFTSQQFTEIGALLGQMPTASLQSLTVSALGYLQRVDAALGHDPAGLISQLPVSLNSVPGISKVLPRLVLPSSALTSGGKGSLPRPNARASQAPVVALPSASTGVKPVNPIPSAVRSISGAINGAGGAVASALPGAVQSLAGQLPGAVQSAAAGVVKGAGATVNAVAGAVTGTLGAVTGGVTSAAGPSLPLPISLPVLPELPGLPH